MNQSYLAHIWHNACRAAHSKQPNLLHCSTIQPSKAHQAAQDKSRVGTSLFLPKTKEGLVTTYGVVTKLTFCFVFANLVERTMQSWQIRILLKMKEGPTTTYGADLLLCPLLTWWALLYCSYFNKTEGLAKSFGGVRRLTSNSGPEEDEGRAKCAILLLNLPRQHHKEQHVGKHMLEAGVDQDTGHPPAPVTVTVSSGKHAFSQPASQNSTT